MSLLKPVPYKALDTHSTDNHATQHSLNHPQRLVQNNKQQIQNFRHYEIFLPGK